MARPLPDSAVQQFNLRPPLGGDEQVGKSLVLNQLQLQADQSQGIPQHPQALGVAISLPLPPLQLVPPSGVLPSFQFTAPPLPAMFNCGGAAPHTPNNGRCGIARLPATGPAAVERSSRCGRPVQNPPNSVHRLRQSPVSKSPPPAAFPSAGTGHKSTARPSPMTRAGPGRRFTRSCTNRGPKSPAARAFFEPGHRPSPFQPFRPAGGGQTHPFGVVKKERSAATGLLALRLAVFGQPVGTAAGILHISPTNPLLRHQRTSR